MGRISKRRRWLRYKTQGVMAIVSYLLLFLGSVFLLPLGCQEQTAVEESSSVQTQRHILTEDKSITVQSGGPGQKADIVSAAPSKKSPRITFEKVVHDFGEIAPGMKQTCKFRFTNTGNGLLKIKEVERCCGVSTRLDKKEYAPGESGILTVDFHSGSGYRRFTRHLHVDTNDEIMPRVTLTINADIVSKISCEPETLKLLLEEENAGCPEIKISSRDNKPFSITGFKATAGCLTADYDPSVQATEFFLQPKADIDKLERCERGNIKISLTHPECDSVDVFFDVLPRFVSSPPQIIVFGAKPNQPVVRKISVLNNYREDFEIESTSSKNNTMKVLSQEKLSSGYQFEVQITPPARTDARSLFTDVFRVKIKGDEQLEIACRGFYLTKR
jgi:hypothetical protein